MGTITIIAGGRDFDDYEFLCECMSTEPLPSMVVSGTARGADQLGEQWAHENQISLARFPADWDQYRKRAGYLRNEHMAAYADRLIAFWNGHSKGTKHMIDIARQQGLDVIICHY